MTENEVLKLHRGRFDRACEAAERVASESTRMSVLAAILEWERPQHLEPNNERNR